MIAIVNDITWGIGVFDVNTKSPSKNHSNLLLSTNSVVNRSTGNSASSMNPKVRVPFGADQRRNFASGAFLHCFSILPPLPGKRRELILQGRGNL